MRLKLVAVAIAALTPVVAMLGFNEVAVRSQRNEEVRVQAASAARLASSEVERIIEGIRSLLSAVTAMPEVRKLNIPLCNELLQSISANVPNIQTIFLLDLNGKIVCGSMDDVSALSFRDREYFRDVISSKEFVVGTYTKSRITGAAVLPVAMPIMEDDRMLAIIATGVLLDWLQDRVADRNVASGNAITIADGKGTILARVPYPERFVGTVIPETYISLIHSERPGILEVVSQDGTERILGYRPIRLPNSPLYVSAGLSRDKAFAPINRATVINTLSILGGAMFAFLASIFVGNRFIARPVSRIADVMENWRSGNTNVRTSMVLGRDELSTVGATLDRLLDELESRRRRSEQAEEERALLARELAHRVKNSFSLVQAMASQTFRRSDPERYAAFSERLAALAGSYNLLLGEDKQASSIRDTIENALKAHQGVASTRFSLQGPTLILPADLTLSLSLVIHELCTNATKYGALSNEDGRVEVNWTLDESRLSLIWQERGGPPVGAPAAKGFGSTLIERAFPSWANPSSDFNFKIEGLVFTLEVEPRIRMWEGGKAGDATSRISSERQR